MMPVVALRRDVRSTTCMFWMFLVVRWPVGSRLLHHAERCLLSRRGHWPLCDLAETVGKATKFVVETQKQAEAACLLVAGGG